jgi:uncharacterized protein YecT (DUF1311 family)
MLSLAVMIVSSLSALVKPQATLAQKETYNLIQSVGEVAQIDRTQSILSETARDVELEKAILQANSYYDSRSIKIFGSHARYFYNKIDLNGDNKPEVLVHVLGPTFCGTGGCTTLIFQSVGQNYQLVSEIRLSRLPIIVTNQKTNGWNDLILNARGGRAATGNSGLYLVRFNGRTYPEAPDRGIKLSQDFSITGKDLFNTNRSTDGIVLQPQDIQTTTGRSPVKSRELPPSTSIAASPEKPAICNQPQTTSQINNCAAALYQQADRRLNEVYKQVISKLNPRDREKLIDEQLAWIQRRDASCKDQGRMTPAGSAYAGARNACLATETDKRTAELEKYLQK